jgi:TRAP-type uncharacterized transport system substrate-binding protein
MSDDLAYAITSAMFENIANFRQFTPAKSDKKSNWLVRIIDPTAPWCDPLLWSGATVPDALRP